MVSIASVSVEDADTSLVMFESVDVAASTNKEVMYAFVVVEFVMDASKSVEDVAVKLFTSALPVNTALSLKSESPLKTALLSVGVCKKRSVAVPPRNVDVSIVASLR